MGRPCVACHHPERAALDAALLAGEGYRAICARFGVAPGSLSRHRAHATGTVATAVPPGGANRNAPEDPGYRNTVRCAPALALLASLPDGCVDAWWASPPYNLRDPLRPGNRVRHRRAYRYAAPQGDGGRALRRGDGSLRPEPQYQAEQAAVLTEWHRTLADDGVAFYNHKVRIKDGRAISPLAWIARTPFVLLQELVWDRGASQNVDPRRFLPVSERISVLAKRPGVRLDNALRLHDVLRIPPNAGNARARSGHPCPTNPAVVRACLSVLPRPADGRRLLVADCYAGTGTTGAVARELGMDYLLGDHAAEYVALAEQRLAAGTTAPLPLGVVA
jgi:hypothetical protein